MKIIPKLSRGAGSGFVLDVLPGNVIGCEGNGKTNKRLYKLLIGDNYIHES
jgi:hypothetical protein